MRTLPDDSWPTGDPALASFVEDLRILAGGPAPEPGPGLVAVMRRGVSDPSPTSPGRRKMLVKTLVGSLAAKVALGLGVAAAGMTAAGAAGVLPDAAQHAVASVVGATTPFAVPDPSTTTASVSRHDSMDAGDAASGTVTTLGDTGTTIPGTVTTLAGGATGTGTGTADDGRGTDATADNHGACVSAAAQDKSGSGSHGKTVSSVARSDCGKASGTTTTVVTPSSTTVPTSSTTSTTSVASRARQNGAGTAGSGAGGNGNGNSGGNSSKATSDSPGKSGKN
jgi:hypothetical protein